VEALHLVGTACDWDPLLPKYFSTSDVILTTVSVALEVKRSGNSNAKNYKLDHITYSNAFSFNSPAFWFMSSITVKWYTSHVYTLYLAAIITPVHHLLQCNVAHELVLWVHVQLDT
jgi:hypothetical protein